ncbi:MAG TPA: amidohydrolase family protein [Blastocatellia bacterium]|nr:amidohydrolase family protein [Blastocatellia bacterium]
MLNLTQVAIAQDKDTKVYEFRNGYWFDGQRFKKRTFYSTGGILTSRKPAHVDSVIDLAGKYLVPPFGEAHNHNLGGASGLERQIEMYLREGVFYSKNLHYVRNLTAPILSRVNSPTSVDVAYAHAGLTASGGHAVELYEKLYDRGLFPGWKKGELDTRTFFIIDSEHELEEKWPVVLAGKPDFIKTYLEYSEEYEKRKGDPKYYGQRGLSPRLLRLIVKKAHDAGLRVSSHIETGADFHNALLAGVDEIAHLPGYKMSPGEDLSRYQISDEDASLAARKGVTVVTTTVLSNSLYRNDARQLKIIQANQVRNLGLLAKHRVKVALGSDTINATSVAEAMNLHALKAFDNLTLLKLWCENTPQAIFPGRRIAYLRDGYEASFLALEGNPLDDFVNVKRIEIRFKQGVFINISQNKQ